MQIEFKMIPFLGNNEKTIHSIRIFGMYFCILKSLFSYYLGLITDF